MKKLMLSLAATALIFASCSKDEVTGVNAKNPNAIGFSTSTGKSRASVNDLTVLQAAANGFGVYATQGTTPTEFIATQGYKYAAGEWAWDGTPNEWPTDGATNYPINFYAFYPKTAAGFTPSLAAGAQTAQYVIEDAAADQIDYLAANSLNVAARPASSDVSLEFKHILSKIDFKIVTGANVDVEVQSIAIKGVGNTGTYNLSTLAWTAAPTTFAKNYTYQGVSATQTFSAATTATAINGGNGSLMLMPQDNSGRAWNGTLAGLTSGAYIEVVYRVLETGANDIIGFTDATEHPDYATDGAGVTGNLFIKVAYALPTNWASRTAYTYTIYLGTTDATGGILINDKFIDEDGDDTNLTVVDPQTGTELDPEEPITDPNKPIGFVVSVSEWGTATNNDVK